MKKKSNVTSVEFKDGRKPKSIHCKYAEEPETKNNAHKKLPKKKKKKKQQEIKSFESFFHWWKYVG